MISPAYNYCFLQYVFLVCRYSLLWEEHVQFRFLRLFPSGCHLLFVFKGVAVKMGIVRIRSEIYAWEFYLDEYGL